MVFRFCLLLFIFSVYLLSEPIKQTKFINYEGPLNLKWGMCHSVADSILKNKFYIKTAFEENGDSTYRYEGTFTGFSNSTIETTFHNDSLFLVGVIISRQGDFPFSRTWFEIIKKTRKKYGDPEKYHFPPSAISSSLDSLKENYPDSKNRNEAKAILEIISSNVDDYEYWDLCIQDGSWIPYASWKFKNAGMFVAVNLSDTDINNIREMSIVWCFFKGKSFKKWIEKRDSIENENSDF